MFVVSHGSWQNRWKISLTPEARPRWTVNTTARIVDLDAPAPVLEGGFAHLAGTYDGERMRLYVDGVLEADVAQDGPIRGTEIPLLLGQMLPGQADFNFPGVIDDVRVYNVALSDDQVRLLFGGATSQESGIEAARLGLPFPNPARDRVTIPFALDQAATAHVSVLDALGRTVAVLHDGSLPAGSQSLTWDLTGSVAAGVYLVRFEDGDGVSTRRVLVAR